MTAEPRYTCRIRPPGMAGRQVTIECATKEQVQAWLWDYLAYKGAGRTIDQFTVEWFSRENVQ